MKSLMTAAALVSLFLFTGEVVFAGWNSKVTSRSAAAITRVPTDPVPMTNTLYGCPPGQVIYPATGEVSYLIVDGDFYNVTGVIVECDVCVFDAEVFYWDADTLVIELVSLGPLETVNINATLLDAGSTVSVTATDTSTGTSSNTITPTVPLGS